MTEPKEPFEDCEVFVFEDMGRKILSYEREHCPDEPFSISFAHNDPDFYGFFKMNDFIPKETKIDIGDVALYMRPPYNEKIIVRFENRVKKGQ